MSQPRKRFIAGAVCPGCQKLDTLVMCLPPVESPGFDSALKRPAAVEVQTQKIECIACGYQETGAERDVRARPRIKPRQAADTIEIKRID